MVLHDGPIIRSNFPRPGSLAGDQKRDEFIAAMLAIMGDPRLLWLPKSGDTTTSTEDSRYAGVITWDATVAGRLSTLGSGLSQSFNGTSHEGDIPDADRYSFGDGAVDQAFSVVALVNPTLGTTIRSIIGKESGANEWWFNLQADETLRLRLTDASAANADITKASTSAITVGVWSLLGATSNGSGSNAGISLYQNAALLAATASSSGTYTAMENGTSLVQIGRRAATLFWADSMAMIAICAKELSPEDQWAMKALVNAFFDLTL